jgi:protein involved in temperature-dependent protein secretion
LITDCHVHIQPFELLLSPSALELMIKHQPDFDRVLEFTRSPKAFLKYMDQAGLDRALLINAAAPDVTGFPAGLNALAAKIREGRSQATDPLRQPASSAFPQHHGRHRGDRAAWVAADQDSTSAPALLSE